MSVSLIWFDYNERLHSGLSVVLINVTSINLKSERDDKNDAEKGEVNDEGESEAHLISSVTK